MILPIANIVSGFVLSAPKLKQWFSKGNSNVEGDIAKAEGALEQFRTPLGVIVLVLGVLGLLQSLRVFGMMQYGFGFGYGSGYLLQAIIAILMGLILSAHFFARWPAFHARIMQIEKYGDWIGILGMIIGVGSLI